MAPRLQAGRSMWADNAQRDRIFEMIGTDTIRLLRVRNARLEHQRHLAAAVLLAAAGVWIAVALAR
jgi:hypothetical protein